MSTLYRVVRFANLLLFGLYLVSAVLGLINHGNQLSTDVTFTVSVCIGFAIAFLGAYGAYKHNRTYLLTFALINLISIILMAFSSNYPYWTQSTGIVFFVLAVVQSELLRRGNFYTSY